MNQDHQSQPWWKDSRLVWVLAALVLTWLLTTTILFPFLLTKILSVLRWQSWDWRWLVLLSLIFLSVGVLYLTLRRGWSRLFDLMGLRGKTLWDFIGLLIVPLVIALAGWWLGEISTRNQQQIEDDRERQIVLQSYIQDMTTLLLDKELAKSEPDNPARDIARSSTLTAVRQLDAERKGILLEFLYESNLIMVDSIISLHKANLSGANLRGTGLSGVNLTDANLSHANLGGAFLSHANLLYANLTGAVLSEANLSGAILNGANLSNANLSDANLGGATLYNTNLSGANLNNANLGGANLLHADLRGARNLTNQQLAQAVYLVEATLPNGRVIETEEDWEEFKKQYRTGS